jgi:glycosyltransferase involved in cell wall biosynthesis
MPLSILEAMGYGQMILASDIQENKDVLSGYGWTFQSGNIDDLSQKLIGVLELEKDSIKHKGNKLKRFGMENYNWDKIADNVEKHLLNFFDRN